MSLLSSLCCVNCFQFYDEDRKPCIGTCHDILCLPCKASLKRPDCPVCGRKDAFVETMVNYVGMEALKEKMEQLTEESPRELMKTQVKKDNGICAECGEICNKLRLCIDCALEQKIIIQLPGATDYVIHEYGTITYLGAFYHAKQMSVCPHCAMDGKHAGHTIQAFSSVYEDCSMDFDLLKALQRLVNQKLKINAENADSYMKTLENSRRNAFQLETVRERRRAVEGMYESLMYFENPMIRHGSGDYRELLVEAEKKSYQMEKRFKMAWVEWQRIMIRIHTREFQYADLCRLVAAAKLSKEKGEVGVEGPNSESESILEERRKFDHFLDEMEKVAARTLLEEEKLEGEEFEEVEKLVKGRILEYCEYLRRHAEPQTSDSADHDGEHRDVFSDMIRAVERIHDVKKKSAEHANVFGFVKEELKHTGRNIVQMMNVATEMDRLSMQYSLDEAEHMLANVVYVKSLKMFHQMNEGLEIDYEHDHPMIKDYLKEFRRLNDEEPEIPETASETVINTC